MTMGLRLDLNEAWNRKSGSLVAMAIEFPAEMAVFYAAMAEKGKQVVIDELMSRVYNQPLPAGSSFGSAPSPRTGRTLRAVRGTWSLMRSSVFVDRRSFPRYFYPWILEHGREGTAYRAREFFRAAMRKMEVIYFREARLYLRAILGKRGLL